MKSTLFIIIGLLFGFAFAYSQVSPDNFYAVLAGTNNDGMNVQLSYPQKNKLNEQLLMPLKMAIIMRLKN